LAGIPILMYHGVSPNASGWRFREFVLEPRRFEAQMEYLAGAGFHVCTVSELVARRACDPAALADTVALTFDDAFHELLEHAFPVLERLGLRTTVYVPTAYIGQTSRWLADLGEGARPLLSASEMRSLPATLVEFGSHSHTHPALDVVSTASARAEISGSKRLLEETLARPVTTFAYPFGNERAATRRLVAEAGYTCACRVGYRHSSTDEDVFGLARIPVYAGVDVDAFATLLSSAAGLRGRRAVAAGWRPIRRGLARLTRPGAA
jgi:peptidoglycan/xylan/chitin deacetylase (PgdA/CDA1 family)